MADRLGDEPEAWAASQSTRTTPVPFSCPTKRWQGSQERTQIALDHAAAQLGLKALLGRAAGQVQADGQVLGKGRREGRPSARTAQASKPLCTGAAASGRSSSGRQTAGQRSSIRALVCMISAQSTGRCSEPVQLVCTCRRATAPTRTASASLRRCMYEQPRLQYLPGRSAHPASQSWRATT